MGGRTAGRARACVGARRRGRDGEANDAADGSAAGRWAVVLWPLVITIVFGGAGRGKSVKKVIVVLGGRTSGRLGFQLR